MRTFWNQVRLLRLRAVLIFGFILLFGLFSFFLVNSNNVSALDGNNCLSCHGKTDVTKTNGDGKTVSLHISEVDINSSAHKYIDCTNCHGSDPHQTPPKLTKLSSAEKCGSCHPYEYQQHLASIHGQQLATGNTDVATCIDCHSPKGDAHSVIRVLDHSAPTYKKNIADTCAKCHNNNGLMQSYGLVDKVYESYMRSYHGKVIESSTDELAQLNTATCTNCHGAHNIKATNDPNSPVLGMDNLVQTCKQCHPNAGPEFVKGFLGHKEASPNIAPAVHYVDRSFSVLLFSVLGFGLLVVLGAIISNTRNHWRG
jgi:hypothetical protein